MRIVVGITGSSGAVYAVDFLKRCPGDKFLIVSKWGKALLKDEVNMTEKDLRQFIKRQFPNDDLTAPLASGSNKFDAYVILPCSTSTLGKIASGIGDTLITRAAQVALKERYKLILCVRETPLSTTALEQCAKLSRDGAIIMPISPPLYFVPKTVEEYVAGFVDKVLGIIGVRDVRGWRAEELE
ncbi:MAG: UbiX family flavin prenyltransferase [Ignavibacteriae bacterium]|nr:UbiX family flavin prenyltransferase [Ignavibacteria bacterium]MBI3365042.1 UbiX family flavin prenyltransferase [Ignavibacteriota bacterium]